MSVRPARAIACFAGVFLPIVCMTWGGGPMNVTPCCAQSSASRGSSERKPHPGCSAVQPLCFAACTTRA